MILTFIIFVFIAFMAAASMKLTEVNEANARQQTEDMVEMIKSEISTAAAAEDGYARQFELPLQLNGAEYSMTLQSGSITLNSGQSWPINSQISGELCPGKNIITKQQGTLSSRCLQ